MWVSKGGRTIHAVDTSRHQYKTNLDRNIIDELRRMANTYNSNVSYLLENGFENMLQEDYSYQLNAPKNRSNRKQILLTMDSGLHDELEKLAAELGVKKNVLLETAFFFIKPEDAKKDKHRYRTEIK